MEINLSWDLFIIVFFSVIIAYSFIIGKSKTLKLIIASYLALLAADGIGNLAYKILLTQSQFIKIFNVDTADKLIIIFKVLCFIIGIVLISIKGGFEVDTLIEKSVLLRSFSTFIFGFMSAGIIISTILTFTLGNSFLDGGAFASQTTSLNIYNESAFAKIMVQNFNLWFSLPALTIILVSIIYSS